MRFCSLKVQNMVLRIVFVNRLSVYSNNQFDFIFLTEIAGLLLGDF